VQGPRLLSLLRLPFALRYRLAYDAKLTSEVLQLLVRAVFCSLRRRARRCGKMANPQCGAVTFVQRFGDAALGPAGRAVG
jgi:hypothetical protein